MDSRIIDVAIGLVLVFALTSLLVSTVVEGFATLRKQRGKVLKQALKSFAGDDAAFANALLTHPLVVSQAQGSVDETREPSYLRGDVIVTSLLAKLTDLHAAGVRPGTPGELMSLVQAGGPAGAVLPNPQFVQGLATLVRGVEADWQAFEKRLQVWYDSVAERSTGWYKRWAQRLLLIMGFGVAAALNIDPIVIAPRLWNDATLREAMANAGVKASAANQGTNGAGQSADGTQGAPGATATGALVQNAPPAPTPEAGKVDASVAKLGAVLKTVSTLTAQNPFDPNAATALRAREELRTLRDDLKRMRGPGETTASGATDWTAAHASVNESLDGRLREFERLFAGSNAYAEARALRDALVADLAAERKVRARRTEQNRMRDCANVGDESTRQLCLRLNDLSALEQAGLPIGWSAAGLPTVFDDGCPELDAAGKRAGERCTTTSYWLAKGGNFLFATLGWFITAVAVTLGAPFWFDLLGKLVKLRGSGPRANGDDKAAADGKASLLTTKGETVPVAREAMSDALNDAERQLTVFEIERVQRGLQLPDAQVTGFFDATTRAAIKLWQNTQSDAATGELTASQIKQLLGLAQEDTADGFLG